MTFSQDLALAAPELILAIGALGLLVVGAFAPRATTTLMYASIAALVVAGLAIREGIEAWRGDIESPFEVLEDLDHDDHEEVTP